MLPHLPGAASTFMRITTFLVAAAVLCVPALAEVPYTIKPTVNSPNDQCQVPTRVAVRQPKGPPDVVRHVDHKIAVFLSSMMTFQSAGSGPIYAMRGLLIYAMRGLFSGNIFVGANVSRRRHTSSVQRG
jgi:hypothetical protein